MNIAESDVAPLVFPIHTAVSGRARYKVDGLKYDQALKQFLESQLKCCGEIAHTSASTITGTLLVYFSSDTSSGHIKNAIAELVFLFRTLPPNSDQLISESERWHARTIEDTALRLGTSIEKGLSVRQSDVRFRLHGPNILLEVARRGKAEILGAQFKTLPVALLSASAALSLFTGGLTEAAVILAVVFANAYIGYAMEMSSENTIRSLATIGPTDALVIRGGKPKKIGIEKIVPGDLIILTPGMYVPADARLVHVEDLTVDESTLTGESALIVKKADALDSASIALGDRVNMLYRGTVITGGKGIAIVVATGKQTEIGKIQSLVADTRPSETPLQKQMERLSEQLISLSGLVGGGLLVAGLLRGYKFWEMLNISISLVIAAVPEGLPTVATTTLTQCARRMRKRNVVVRKLDAIETLGSAEIVCLDKTGTLTMNHMTAVAIFSGMQRHSAPLAPAKIPELSRFLETMSLCNDTEIKTNGKNEPHLNGSSTEVALIELALQSGLDVCALQRAFPLQKTRHRANGRNFMVTEHSMENGSVLEAIKGNPSEVLALCNSHLVNGKEVRLTAAARKKIEDENTRMAGDALRVLGVAYSEQSRAKKQSTVFLGLVGLADVAREGIADFIAALQRCGIKTVMITGDQAATAYAMARALGISGQEPLEVFDATQLASLTSGDVTKIAEKTHVFARVSPSDKLQIVQALKAGGKTVAMVGDGVNDAPALRGADVGIAMGKKGTDVAREVASVVLLDDRLESLVPAIELGRATNDAIRKSVTYLLTTNLSETLLMSGAVISGLGQPLNPIQLLWINLVSDVFPALALGLEPPESDVLNRAPRRPDESLLSGGDCQRIARESALMTGTTLAAYGYGISRYGLGPHAQAIAFTSLVGSQLLHTLSSRSEKHTIFGGTPLKRNKYIPLSVGLGFGLQFLAVAHPHVRRVLGIAPLGGVDLLVCAAGAGFNFLFNETKRSIRL